MKLLLLVSSFLLMRVWLISSVNALETDAICPVGQLGKCKNCDLCDSQNSNKCFGWCKEEYGADLVTGATCSKERESGKRECICHLKCVNAGCWGDPHCWSFDHGDRLHTFGYQGHCKHWMFKPCKPMEHMPNFEIRQSNKYWYNGPAATLDISELVVPEFGQIIEIRAPEQIYSHYTLKVNGMSRDLPYRYSNVHDCTEDYIYVHYAAHSRNQVIVETSFGLRITYDYIQYANGYSDIMVDIPKHPELKGNTCGLWGNWNNDAKDDFFDNGIEYAHDEGFSWAWGDHWKVPGSCDSHSQREIEEPRVAMLNDPARRAEIQKLCQDNFQNIEWLNKCAQKTGYIVPSVDDCVMDLIFIDNPVQRNDWIKGQLSKFAIACGGTIDFKGAECCPNKALLFHHQLRSEVNLDNKYTTEMFCGDDKATCGYKLQAYVGMVATGKKDCYCRDGYVAVYELERDDGKEHIYSTSNQKTGYRNKGVAFYCAPNKDHCGATLPLNRYNRETTQGIKEQYIRTSPLVADHQPVDANPLCYIWPYESKVN